MADDQESSPWQDYQSGNTAVADETDGPWSEFKSDSPEPESAEPWLDFQSSQPEPQVQQVNSLAPQMDMSLLAGAGPATTVELGTPGDAQMYHPPTEAQPDYLNSDKVAAQEQALSRGLLTRAGVGAENMPTGQELMTATGAHPSIAYPLSAVSKTVTGVVDWMTSPVGFPQLVAASIPGVNLIMGAKFAKEMIEGGYVSAKDVGVGLAEGNWQKVADGVSNYAANVLGVKSVVGHGIKNAKAETGKFGDFLQGPGPEFNVERAAALGGQPVRFSEPTEQSGVIPPSEPIRTASSELPASESTPATAPAGGGSVADELIPALRTKGGKLLPGQRGQTHNDVYAAQGDIEGKMLRVEQPEHGFVRNGEFLSREEAAKLVGETEPLQSERLMEIQKPSEATAPKVEISSATGDRINALEKEKREGSFSPEKEAELATLKAANKTTQAIAGTVDPGMQAGVENNAFKKAQRVSAMSVEDVVTAKNKKDIALENAEAFKAGTKIKDPAKIAELQKALDQAAADRVAIDKEVEDFSNSKDQDALMRKASALETKASILGNYLDGATGKASNQPTAIHEAYKKSRQPAPAAEAPADDLVPNAKGNAPELERVRNEIEKAEIEKNEAAEAASGEDVPLDDPLHEVTKKAQSKLDALRERGKALEREATSKAIGMGGATPEEVAPQGTGLKNETGRLERVLHGLPEEYQTVARSMPQVWLEADNILKADPKAGEKLAAELKIDPQRGMSDTDSALLLRHKVALENAKNEAASDTFTAETASEKAEAQARFDGLSQELLALLDAAKFRGSQWGREGRWRQALAFDDYSLETMKRDKKLSLDRELTPEENAQIQKLHERISELEKELAYKTKSNKAVQRISAVTETVADTAKRAKASAANDKAKGVGRDLAGEETDAINHLKERLIEQGDLTGANPTIKKLMELLYRKGHTERISLENAVHDILKKQVDPTIPLEEVQDLMSGYGKYTEPSKDPVKAGVREVQGQILQVKKMLDIVRKGFAKPTGFLRQQAGQVQRNLQKAVNELKKQYGIPQDSAKALQSALDTVKTRLRNRILDIKQELANKEKIISKRSPSPSDAETIKLRQELDELQKQRDEMFPKEPITPEEQLKRLEASADRQIKQLERNIVTGEIFPKGKQPSNLNSERLAAARAKIEALKQERDAMRETIQPTAEPEAVQLQQLLNRLRNREVEYKDRLARGRFEPRAKKEQPVSKEVLDARARVETAKRDFQKGLTLDKMKRRSLGQKLYAGTKEALNLPRAALTAFDVSAVLRQGGFIGFGHPIRASTSIIPMFKALASEKYALRTEQEILSRPNAGRYASSKLYLASFDEFRLSKQEEIMMSRFANVLPGVRPSNRAFMTFLNKLRADSFDAMTKSLESRGTKLQPNELEAVSNYINVATGRGDLGKAAAAAETLATVFFSPRNAISRFQLIAGQPAYRGSARTRVLIASEYARMLGGLAVIYGLGTLAGAKVETDPRATDFGKLRFGNTRVDPLTGLSQATVLLSRVGSGEQKTGKGKIVPVRGEKVPYGSANSADLLARFARTKLAPTVGTTVNVLTGKNVVGQPVTPGSAAIDLVTPLSMKDIYDVMKEQGVSEGTAFGILSLFGMSVQNYEPMKPKSSGVKYEKSN